MLSCPSHSVPVTGSARPRPTPTAIHRSSRSEWLSTQRRTAAMPPGCPGHALRHQLPFRRNGDGGRDSGHQRLVDNYDTVNFTTPAVRPAQSTTSSLTDVDGTAGTIPNGWVADFVDVPKGGNSFIQLRLRPGSQRDHGRRRRRSVRRGRAHDTPADGGFPDEGQTRPLLHPAPLHRGHLHRRPLSSNFAPWIYELVAEGVSGGCGDGRLLPGRPGRRDQMAAFLLKARGRSATHRRPGHGDVYRRALLEPVRHWIEQLVARSITGGCGDGRLLPRRYATRGQMAVFLSITFGLF